MKQSSRLNVSIAETAARWESEQAIAAIQLFKKGVQPKLVIYPTGLRKLRFECPETWNHNFFEVSEALWERIKKDGYCLVG